MLDQVGFGDLNTGGFVREILIEFVRTQLTTFCHGFDLVYCLNILIARQVNSDIRCSLLARQPYSLGCAQPVGCEPSELPRPTKNTFVLQFFRAYARSEIDQTALNP